MDFRLARRAARIFRRLAGRCFGQPSDLLLAAGNHDSLRRNSDSARGIRKISGSPPGPIKRDRLNPAGNVAKPWVSPRHGGGCRSSTVQMPGNTRGCAIRRRTSPVAARPGEVGGESAVVAGSAPRSSSAVVWLIAGPGLPEAELAIGRLRAWKRPALPGRFHAPTPLHCSALLRHTLRGPTPRSTEMPALTLDRDRSFSIARTRSRSSAMLGGDSLH